MNHFSCQIVFQTQLWVSRSQIDKQSAEITDGIRLSASSSTACIWKETIWVHLRLVAQTLFYVWSQTHHSFAFLHSQKKKRKKKKKHCLADFSPPRLSTPTLVSGSCLWRCHLHIGKCYSKAKTAKTSIESTKIRPLVHLSRPQKCRSSPPTSPPILQQQSTKRNTWCPLFRHATLFLFSARRADVVSSCIQHKVNKQQIHDSRNKQNKKKWPECRRLRRRDKQKSGNVAPLSSLCGLWENRSWSLGSSGIDLKPGRFLPSFSHVFVFSHS